LLANKTRSSAAVVAHENSGTYTHWYLNKVIRSQAWHQQASGLQPLAVAQAAWLRVSFMIHPITVIPKSLGDAIHALLTIAAFRISTAHCQAAVWGSPSHPNQARPLVLGKASQGVSRAIRAMQDMGALPCIHLS